MEDKKVLTFDELEAQTAVELPDRETLLVTVVITNLLNNNVVEITVQDVNVAAQICAQLIATGRLDCEIQQ